MNRWLDIVSARASPIANGASVVWQKTDGRKLTSSVVGQVDKAIPLSVVAIEQLHAFANGEQVTPFVEHLMQRTKRLRRRLSILKRHELGCLLATNRCNLTIQLDGPN